MPRHARSALTAVALSGVALAGASVARANFVAVATDPAGDVADPSPGRDIIAVGLAYDRDSGELAGGVQLRGAPVEGATALVSLFAGTQTASGCDGVPAAGFGSYSDEFGASWLRLDGPGPPGARGDADKSGYKSAVQEFETTDPQLQGHSLNCVVATLSEPGNAANIYDTVGPLPLVGQPELSLKLSGIPRSFRAGRSRKITLTLANGGDGPTEPVRLKLSRARGMNVKPKSRSLKAIAPGGSMKVRATVTLSSKARTSTDLTVTAAAGELVARQKTRLHLRTPSKPGGGGGNDGATKTCTRWMPDPFGGTGGSLILVAC